MTEWMVQMGGGPGEAWSLLLQIGAAVVGTVSFSVLFGVPRAYYPYCGAIGGAGWLVYSFIGFFLTEPVSCFLATAVVLFLSRLAAVYKHCPATIFLIPGIFPLVPGAGVYWTVYYLVMEELGQAVQTGYAAVQMAGSIVLGIVCVFELPQSLFVTLTGRRRKK